MSKRVSLNVRIDKTGKVYAKPEGTKGEECIDLMRFLDLIPGLVVEEVGHTEDYKQGEGCVTEQEDIHE
jgi:hypothetical protein